jgi:hypothetical protein
VKREPESSAEEAAAQQAQAQAEAEEAAAPAVAVAVADTAAVVEPMPRGARDTVGTRPSDFALSVAADVVSDITSPELETGGDQDDMIGSDVSAGEWPLSCAREPLSCSRVDDGGHCACTSSGCSLASRGAVTSRGHDRAAISRSAVTSRQGA